MQNKYCKNCNRSYSKKPNLAWKIWIERSKYCSRACMQAINPGGLACKGKPSWNKGIAMREDSRAKLSKTITGRKMPPHFAREHRERMLGRKITWADKISQSLSGKARARGKYANNWQGGKTSKSKIVRNSLEYKQWRGAVFERDNYTCQTCGQIGGRLQADHIKPFAFFPELRLELSNGRTLCEECHRKTDTYATGSLKYAKRSTSC